MTDLKAEIANTLKEIEGLKEETREIVAKMKKQNAADKKGFTSTNRLK
ncbi:MAG: hypothetical protein MJK15_18590 [Colwellia sp.]|nr:hypothetical protein [Colwellia sp.]